MRLRLRGEGLHFWVALDVRRVGAHWLAVADLAGEKEIGMGGSPRAAVADAVAPLGWRAMTALLADLAISDVEASSEEWPGDQA